MAGVSAATPASRRHDPRIEPPTKADRRRSFAWVAFLGLTPICIGVVLWAALGLNGGYPTVRPVVPRGWQAVPGIYASFSVPKNWSLNQFMSDAQGDVYYSGRSGAAGESVSEQRVPPHPGRALPEVVGTFLGGKYEVGSIVTARVHNATSSWYYRFRLPGDQSGIGVLAWVKATQSQVWLVASPDNPVTRRALSTLTLGL